MAHRFRQSLGCVESSSRRAGRRKRPSTAGAPKPWSRSTSHRRLHPDGAYAAPKHLKTTTNPEQPSLNNLQVPQHHRPAPQGRPQAPSPLRGKTGRLRASSGRSPNRPPELFGLTHRHPQLTRLTGGTPCGEIADPSRYGDLALDRIQDVVKGSKKSSRSPESASRSDPVVRDRKGRRLILAGLLVNHAERWLYCASRSINGTPS